MIATYGKGYAIYPTAVYEKYNRYLINKYYNLDINLYGRVQYIREVTDLLNDNTSNDVKKILNVTDWEEKLNHYYHILNTYLFTNQLGLPLKTLNDFLRKEKLEKLGKC